MSVRVALLALLQSGARHGYQLKAEFDDITGDAWPLNYGQVYTTLQRLEKVGAVTSLGEDEDGRVRYAVTPTGEAEVSEWLATPVQQPLGSRDEIAMKVLVAVHLESASAIEVIDTQRQATMSTLQSVTKLKAAGGELAWMLHLDRTAILANAELSWLDLAEERIIREPEDRSSEIADTSDRAERNEETVKETTWKS